MIMATTKVCQKSEKADIPSCVLGQARIRSGILRYENGFINNPSRAAAGVAAEPCHGFTGKGGIHLDLRVRGWGMYDG
jgi:hypothetical protein